MVYPVLFLHLKTGTLCDVSALAGYVYTASDRRVAFVMLANARRANAAQRALLEWVWADVPSLPVVTE